MSKHTHDEELVFELVQAALLEKPQSMPELYALFDYDITQDELDDAICILEDAGAIEVFKGKQEGERVRIYRIKSEARTYVVCEFCKGSGYNPDSKRGMCKWCHGNGVYTVNAFTEGSEDAYDREAHNAV